MGTKIQVGAVPYEYVFNSRLHKERTDFGVTHHDLQMVEVDSGSSNLATQSVSFWHETFEVGNFNLQLGLEHPNIERLAQIVAQVMGQIIPHEEFLRRLKEG